MRSIACLPNAGGLCLSRWTVGGGPGSHCGPCISWGGHSELLDSLGERTRIYSEIPAKSKPTLVILSDTITEHQGLDSITLG